MKSASNNAVFDKVLLAVERTVYTEGLALSRATRIVDDLRIGRFGRLKLVLYLEETFDAEIPDEAVERFATVGDIVRYIDRWSHEHANVSAYAHAAEPAWVRA